MNKRVIHKTAIIYYLNNNNITYDHRLIVDDLNDTRVYDIEDLVLQTYKDGSYTDYLFILPLYECEIINKLVNTISLLDIIKNYRKSVINDVLK
jgi:hypothetical protein